MRQKERNDILKVIAMVTMFIDHLGHIVFPSEMWLRIIGRVSFPIFAYFISVGYVHTKSFKKYLLRILICGLVFQFVYALEPILNELSFAAFEKSFFKDFNIFFTLAGGLILIYAYDHIASNKINIGLFLGVIALFAVFNEKIDYGIYGLLFIFIFYFAYDDTINIYNFVIILNFVCFYIGIVFPQHYEFYPVQLFSLISLPIIFHNYHYNIKLPRWTLYLFYPIHFIFLYYLKTLL